MEGKMLETSMLLVKPDGVKKGLVNEIREILLANSLIVVMEKNKVLSRKTVIKLYSHVGNISDRIYFPELVDFMTSSEVHIFIVEGDNAVSKIRLIIGKREPPSGIREKWAESIIKNIAHGPHTLEEAKMEINLILGD
ncbi:MAG: nucleoside-diphosphate kinase [Patescibacteria group bacterium]